VHSLLTLRSSEQIENVMMLSTAILKRNLLHFGALLAIALVNTSQLSLSLDAIEKKDDIESASLPFVHHRYRSVQRIKRYCERYPQEPQIDQRGFGSCAVFDSCNEADRLEAQDFMDRLDVSHVQNYLQFWGQARTGHSWIGAALDAAPDALVANELDVWKHLEDFTARGRGDLWREIAYNSFQCGMYGRYQVYDYTIPNFSQGLVEEGHKITLMGDKKGQSTTTLFYKLGQPWGNETSAQLQRDHYQQLRNLVGSKVTIKNVAILRNPFNMIATQLLRRNRSNETAVPHGLIVKALDLQRQIHWAMNNLGDDWFVFSMETFATDTENQFRRMCVWLKITCSDELIETVVRRTRREVHETRQEVQWSAPDKDLINAFIRDYMSDYYDEWD